MAVIENAAIPFSRNRSGVKRGVSVTVEKFLRIRRVVVAEAYLKNAADADDMVAIGVGNIYLTATAKCPRKKIE